jgi:hypothetical protein
MVSGVSLGDVILAGQEAASARSSATRRRRPVSLLRSARMWLVLNVTAYPPIQGDMYWCVTFLKAQTTGQRTNRARR